MLYNVEVENIDGSSTSTFVACSLDYINKLLTDRIFRILTIEENTTAIH